MSPPTTLAKALALIEAHRKVTPEPPGVRYVAVTFECDDDAPRAYIRSVINDAPVVAVAFVEATDLLKGAAGILEGEGFHRSAGIIRAFLAKHGGA